MPNLCQGTSQGNVATGISSRFQKLGQIIGRQSLSLWEQTRSDIAGSSAIIISGHLF